MVLRSREKSKTHHDGVSYTVGAEFNEIIYNNSKDGNNNPFAFADRHKQISIFEFKFLQQIQISQMGKLVFSSSIAMAPMSFQMIPNTNEM